MPPRLPWQLVQTDISHQEAEQLVDGFRSEKTIKISGSNIITCTICADAIPHTMRYRILKCISPSCAESTVPDLPCPWKAKVMRCVDQDVASVSTTGEHFVPTADPRIGRLTSKQKALAGSLAGNGLKPMQILNRFAVRSGPSPIPALRKLQNYVTYYRKTQMGNTDDLDEVEKQIKAAAYTGVEEEQEPFSFTVISDPDGSPHVGDGSDDDPFIIGVTTKILLRRLDRDPGSFVFHLDTTFKLNQVGYPVMVCGISDCNRSFHVVALFVMSQRQTVHCTTALASLAQIYTKVTGKPLRIRFMMGDADDAQVKAATTVFHGCEFDYLMCFYHMIAKLLEHSASVPPAKASLVIADIYDMHCATSPAEFLSKKTAAVMRWRSDPEVAEFGDYIYKQWLIGSFAKWQCHLTPVGYATTNNPVEQFNNKLKRDYTARQRLKMGLLLVKFADCCLTESLTGALFACATTATSKLKNRARDLRREELLVRTPALDEAASDGFVLVLSLAVPRVRVPKQSGRGKAKQRLGQAATESVEIFATGQQFKVNNARMERDGQPDAGWSVDLHKRLCPCKYFFKYGQCVHLLFALYVTYGNDNPPQRTLVNRSQHGKKRSLDVMIADAVASARASRGRPILNGPALSLV